MINDAWQAVCNRIVQEHKKTNDQDLMDLFKDMDRSMQVYFEDKKIANNSMYNVYMSDQSVLKFIFFEWYTTLYHIKKGNESCIVSENNYHSRNYAKLRDLENKIRTENMHLGIYIPPKFIKCLKDIEPGELLTFSNESTYACFDHQKDILTLKQCCRMSKATDNIFELYDRSKNYRINTASNDDIYNFYSDITEAEPVLSYRKADISTRPQELLNKYTNDLDGDKLRKFQFGPFKVRATRSNDKKKLLWYDDMGNRISQLDVKIMIAWLDTTPIVTDFQREDSDTEDSADTVYDEKVKALLEQLYASGRFKDLYNVIGGYCKKQNGRLNITLRTYNATKRGFEAVGFSFVYKNNAVKVFKLQYENNNINNDILSVSPTSIDEFEEMCKNKKENYKSFVKDKVKENIKHKAPNQKLDLIADIIAQNRIETGRSFELLGSYNKDESVLVNSYIAEADKIKQFNAKEIRPEPATPKSFVMTCGLPNAGKTQMAQKEVKQLLAKGYKEYDAAELYPVDQAITDTFPIFDKNRVLEKLEKQPVQDDKGFVVISLNDIRQEFFKRGEQATGNYLNLITEARMTAALSRGYSVIYDAMNLDRKTREDILSIADKYNVSEKKLIVNNITKQQIMAKSRDNSDIQSVNAAINMADRLNKTYPTKKEGWTHIEEHGVREQQQGIDR